MALSWTLVLFRLPDEDRYFFFKGYIHSEDDNRRVAVTIDLPNDVDLDALGEVSQEINPDVDLGLTSESPVRLTDAEWREISLDLEGALTDILGAGSQTALAWARTPELYARPGDVAPAINDFVGLHADDATRDAFGQHGVYRYFHGNEDDLFIADARPAWVVGNTGDDVMIGGPDDDYLLGYPGDDILGGSLGDDTLFGGPGDDLYVIVDAGDRVRELDDEGFDTARVLFDGFKAPWNLERVEIWNHDGIEVTGSGSKQWFEGGDGGDVIRGGGRSDKIYGEGGDDVLIGAGDVML